MDAGYQSGLTFPGDSGRVALALVASIVLFAVLIFAPAGRFDWPAGWLYLGLISGYLLSSTLYLERANPGLIAHRLHLAPGTKRWDIVWGAFFAPAMIAIYVIAGIDAVRYEWSVMSPWLWPLGLGLFVSGMILLSWAMGVNPFFEKTVRIQTERGHHVVDTGPYALVRHPGYLGFLGWCISAPLLLGSWWALVPASLSIIGLVVRTALEDGTLREELAGYEAYASRVPYRLIDGFW